MVDDVTVTSEAGTGVPLRTLQVEVIDGPDVGLTFASEGERVSLGTANGNDVVLRDPTVSRYHVELRRVADRIEVVDHGSTNGTRVGSTEIRAGKIAPHTTLKLGETAVRVSDGDVITLPLHAKDHLAGIKGSSPSIRRLMALLQRVAPTGVSVLLIGETGTGKEVFAQTVHQLGSRPSGPFETVDCGTLQPTLIASELFGHEKGAFTGAEQQHRGAFERANGGTVFLDEIGELPMTLQPLLLGALERRKIRRVGGRDLIPIDVRVVCATNRDLRAQVNAGAFRQDLYYRIAVSTLELPPLRDRIGDLYLLIEHFLDDLGYEGRPSELISASALDALEKYHWPGNVRELRNFVEVSVAMGEPPALLPPPRQPGSREDHSIIDLDVIFGRPYPDARSAVLERFEGAYIGELMDRAGGNISKAARAACITRSHLHTLLNRQKQRTGSEND